MSGFQTKTAKPNRQSTASDLHDRWRTAFFNHDGFKIDEDTDEPNYLPGEHRIYAPSRNAKKALKILRKFEENLDNSRKNLNTALQLNLNANGLLGEENFQEPTFPFWAIQSAAKINIFFNEIKSEIGFISAMQNRPIIKGRISVIPSFIAELILSGFELHSNNKDKKTGFELMRTFFLSNGEFHRQIVKFYGSEDTKGLIKSLCGKDENKPLSKWVKNFRDRAFENIVLPDDNKDMSANNKERTRRGFPKEKGLPLNNKERRAVERTDKVQRRIDELAYFIRSISNK